MKTNLVYNTERQFSKGSHISTCLENRGTDHPFFQAMFQGCLYSKQPLKTEHFPMEQGKGII